MRILLVHNRFQQRGGEDAVFEAERQLLREHGHEVLQFTRSNDVIGAKGSARTALAAVWAQSSYKQIRHKIRSTKPDILHVHNYIPLISPAVFFAGYSEKVPVVQTLHNYRYICLNSMLSREQRICEDCVDKRIKWPGVIHRCYRGSVMASATVAAMLSVHDMLGTWRIRATRYLALTEFQKKKLVSAEIPLEKIVVKPNFCIDPGVSRDTEQPRSRGLYVGRLIQEKGIEVLVGAASKCDVSIDLVGSGPALERLAAQAPDNLHIHGFVDDDSLLEMKRVALFAILPSIIYEGFPMVIPEMFAMGVPVIASRHGGMQEIIEDGVTGLHFRPGDADDLAAKIRWADEHPESMLEMGRNARKTYEERFSPEPNHGRLMEIYEEAIVEVAGGKEGGIS